MGVPEMGYPYFRKPPCGIHNMYNTGKSKLGNIVLCVFFFFKLSFIAAKCSAKHSIHFHALMGICPPAVPAYHLCAPD